MTTTVHHNTPEITVLGQGGHILRRLRYCRTETAGAAEERIARSLFNDLDQHIAILDARLFAVGATPNFQNQFDLGGQVLRTAGVDAGISHSLYDIEGRPQWQRDSRGTVQRYAYDALGRLTTRYEDLEGSGKQAVRERLVYGEDPSIAHAVDRNLRGQPARHYDTAGLADQTDQGYALSGGMLAQTRRLLPVDTASDWQGEDAAAWQAPLETAHYTTRWTYNARGQVLQQTDAEGHVQTMGYDVRGRLTHSGVTPLGKPHQAVLISQRYNAAGQKQREVAGNGVVTDYVYEAETQRLLETMTRRGDQSLLQHLVYSYDPVGNITAISDRGQAIGYFRNRKVTADKTYTYDSLYQLIHAAGQENATASPAPVDIDDPAAVVPIDQNRCTPYTRRYRYDSGGNLTQIQHQGGQRYTRHVTVSARSNHAVRDNLAADATGVDTFFDAAGNQIQLDTGQTLQWNGLNQLRQVTTVERSQAADDCEVYQYDGGGMRIRKVQRTQSGKTTQTQEVIYLPGLELRRTDNGDHRTEDLHMLTLGAAGRSQVRLLHWRTGNPPDIPDQQLRYSLDDHLGSSQLELDQQAKVLTREDYYPYGGTAVRAARSETQVQYKIIRYSGKARDGSGLYYYGHRYYQPWLGRWLSADPAGAVDGVNLYRMARNNPINLIDRKGTKSSRSKNLFNFFTFAFRRKGEGAATSAKRGTKYTRTVLNGLAVAGAVAGIATLAGATAGIALGVAAAGFLVGAAIGFFYKKLSEKSAGLVAKAIRGKSVKTQAAAGGIVGAAVAKAGGATKRQIAIASVIGTFSGAVGAVIDDSDRGMGAANAAGVSVSTVHVLEGKESTVAMETGAAFGGAAGGLLTGTEGSAEVGENAAYGAVLGGKAGRFVDSIVGNVLTYVSKEAVKTAVDTYLEPKGFIKDTIHWGIDKFADSITEGGGGLGGQAEWAGAMVGGFVGGVGTAAYQLSKDTEVGKYIETAAATVNTYAGQAMDYVRSSVVANAARSLTLDAGKSFLSSAFSFW